MACRFYSGTFKKGPRISKINRYEMFLFYKIVFLLVQQGKTDLWNKMTVSFG